MEKCFFCYISRGEQELAVQISHVICSLGILHMASVGPYVSICRVHNVQKLCVKDLNVASLSLWNYFPFGVMI